MKSTRYDNPKRPRRDTSGISEKEVALRLDLEQIKRHCDAFLRSRNLPTCAASHIYDESQPA